MKKIISKILMLMMVFSLVACGNEKKGDSDGNPIESAETNKIDLSTINWEAFYKDGQVDNDVFFENDVVKITAVEINYYTESFVLNLLVENKSDETFTLISGSKGYNRNSMNGIMISQGYVYVTVEPGQQAEGTAQFVYDSLLFLGINRVADIELGFYLDYDDKNKDDVILGPQKVKTSVYDEFDFDPGRNIAAISSDELMKKYEYTFVNYEENELYNENGVRVVSSGIRVHADGSEVLMLEVVNDNEEQYLLSASKVSVNGLQIHSPRYTRIPLNGGTRGVLGIDLSEILIDGFREVFGIEDISELSLNLTLFEKDGKEIAVDSKTIRVKWTGTNTEINKDGTVVYEGNDLKITYKTILLGEESYYYGNSFVSLLLIENTGSETRNITDKFGYFYVNDKQFNGTVSKTYLPAGQSAILKVTLDGYDLQQNGYQSISDIRKVEFNLQIKDGDNQLIDTPLVTLNY